MSKVSFIESRKPTTPYPTEREDKKHKIYKWGEDNLYPQWLNYLYKSNPIHGGIINSKVHYITSGGVSYDGQDLDKWNRMLANGNSDFDLIEVIQKLALDFEISNKMIIRGVWSLDKTYVEKLEWIDFEEGRKMVGSENLKVSKDWTDRKQAFKIYEPLDLSKRYGEFYIEFQETNKQSLIKKGSRSISKKIYPTPTYSGGLTAIQTGIAVDTFQLSEITNGFSGGTLISLNNGQPTDPTDKEKIEDKIKDSSNPESANSTIITYSLGKEYRTTVESLTGNNLADRYVNVEKGSAKKTLQSHSVTTPILFGYKEEGSLGNATELEIGYEIMKSNYFSGRQNAIMALINFIAKKCNGLQGNISFNEVNLNINKEKPVFKKDEFSEDLILKELSNCGEPKESFNILKSYEMQDLECDYLDLFLKDGFNGLTERQSNVLSLISDGQDFNTIRKSLDVNSSDLAKDYSKLINQSLINKDGGITREGTLTVARSNAKRLSVVFSYEERKDAPALVEGGESRPFCTTLLRLNRVYTRQQIDLITARQGYNVFAYKGGWYKNPNTGKNEPSCRHTWVSNIVFN